MRVEPLLHYELRTLGTEWEKGVKKALMPRPGPRRTWFDTTKRTRLVIARIYFID